MKTARLVLSLSTLLVLPELSACDDGPGGRGPDTLGEEETEGGGGSTGGMTTGISATTDADPSGSTGGSSSTGAGSTTGTGEGETGSIDVLDTTGEGETGTTGGVQEAREDGDNQNDPAVHAQFRATSGPPVSVAGPLFNEEPLDVLGVQYSDAVSVPGDDLDVVHFHIVPGQNDPTITIELACDLGDEALVRASLYDDEGELVDSVYCGEGPQDVLLVNASSTDTYRVDVEALDDAGIFTNYTLSIDGYCFGGCDYAPYEG